MNEGKRFASIWFRHLTTDRMAIVKPELRDQAFVLVAPQHGRNLIIATNQIAKTQGIALGMVLADAKAAVPGLEAMDYPLKLAEKLLHAIGLWCLRYTPLVALDPPDGLLLDITGCTHLWQGERNYIKEIVSSLRNRGYDTRMSISTTIGTAWAIARFGKTNPIIADGDERDALFDLPTTALRLEPEVLVRLHKLGMRSIGSFIDLPQQSLRRRFGEGLLIRLRQALGLELESFFPIRQPVPYTEELPCLEPIRTASGIEIAIQHVLEKLCRRLHEEGKGLRTGTLRCHRIDGKVVQIGISTNRPSAQPKHLFSLFSLKIPLIEPALGIELFILDAAIVEDIDPMQEVLWDTTSGLDTTELAELLDRLSGKTPNCTIRRYLPEEHHWPERSFRAAISLEEKPTTTWQIGRPRPSKLLEKPEPIVVTAPIPDYPPMLFKHQGKVHHIKKAEGPERIEREWWLDPGPHRDYYYVEDEEGQRYWIFRSGHYDADAPQRWFLHGFFA